MLNKMKGSGSVQTADEDLKERLKFQVGTLKFVKCTIINLKIDSIMRCILMKTFLMSYLDYVIKKYLCVI